MFWATCIASYLKCACKGDELEMIPTTVQMDPHLHLHCEIHSSIMPLPSISRTLYLRFNRLTLDFIAICAQLDGANSTESEKSSWIDIFRTTHKVRSNKVGGSTIPPRSSPRDVRLQPLSKRRRISYAASWHPPIRY